MCQLYKNAPVGENGVDSVDTKSIKQHEEVI